MESQLAQALAELDAHESAIPADKLRSWIENCGICIDDVQRFCRFQPKRYVRNLMRGGSAYHALVLCWRNGQRSPIHDHRGSECAVKVLAGEAVETNFEIAPNGMAFAVSSRVLTEGQTCCSEDADIHQLSNLQPGEQDLVTLHVYSPPLLKMNVYSLLGDEVYEFVDPVNDEFALGAGI